MLNVVAIQLLSVYMFTPHERTKHYCHQNVKHWPTMEFPIGRRGRVSLTWTGYGCRGSLASRSRMTAIGYHCLVH